MLCLSLLLPAVASAGLFLTPGVSVHTHSDANTGGGSLALSGTLSSAKACATDYLRVGPNYCARNIAAQLAAFNVSTTTACTQSTALTGVSDAKAVLMAMESNVTSNNAIALRQAVAQIYSPVDTNCNGPEGIIGNFGGTVREFAAVAVGTQILVVRTTIVAPSDASGRFYFTATINGGTSTAATAYVLGYFD